MTVRIVFRCVPGDSWAQNLDRVEAVVDDSVVAGTADASRPAGGPFR